MISLTLCHHSLGLETINSRSWSEKYSCFESLPLARSLAVYSVSIQLVQQVIACLMIVLTQADQVLELVREPWPAILVP